MLQAMVVYSSHTGNTQKIATAIFAAIPGDSKDLQRIEEYSGKEAETYFIGFWTDKGNCDEAVGQLLQKMHGKRVALFGTCGMGNDAVYYDRIMKQVRENLAPDNQYLGMFLCQGKMPMQVRNRYESLLPGGEKEGWIRRMILNFDEALLHPDRTDEMRAAAFAREMIKQ